MASSKLTLGIDTEAVKSWLKKADMVPVVRCKDCDYYEETDSKVGTCLLTNCGAFPSGYCAWAERKEDGEEHNHDTD